MLFVVAYNQELFLFMLLWALRAYLPFYLTEPNGSFLCRKTLFSMTVYTQKGRYVVVCNNKKPLFNY